MDNNYQKQGILSEFGKTSKRITIKRKVDLSAKFRDFANAFLGKKKIVKKTVQSKNSNDKSEPLTTFTSTSTQMPGFYSQKKNPLTAIFSKLHIKSLLRIFIILGIVFGIVFFGKQAFNLLGNGKKEQGAETPTPTVPIFRTQQPSVYAGDEKILEIEKKVNDLDKQMSSAKVKETILNPPALDFDINFEIK